MRKKQSKTIKSPKSPQEIAETILKNLAYLTDEIKIDQEQAQKEMEALRQKWAPLIETWKKTLKNEEKYLIKLMKANKGALFSDTDKVSLDSGALFYSKGDVVHLPRDVVEKILAQGEAFEDGILRDPTLNRQVVENWPDEKLTVIGGERKEEESYSYELKERVA